MKWLYSLSMITFILLVCLQHAQAFDVSISVGPDQESTQVQVSGQDVHIITSQEATAFGLTSQAVMNFLTSFSGQTPDDYSLCDPTDNGNNYANYGFPQVQTTLTAVNAQIVSYTTQPIILAPKTYDNVYPEVANFDGDISDHVTNTVETDWSQTSTITATQTIKYGVSFAGGSTSLSFSTAFQQGGSQSQTISVGTSSGFNINIPPYQSVDASLSATLGTMTINVNFEATLSGDIYYHYDNRYNGHYYWFVDVNELASQTITITNQITINFYSAAQIILTDPDQTNQTPAAGFWEFDEGTGTTSADSGDSTHLVTAILNDATWISRGSGSGVHIDGSDDSYISFGNTVGQFGTNDFTVSFWMMTSDTSLALSDIIGNRYEPSNGNFFGVRMTNDGYIVAEIDQDGSGTNYIGIKSSTNNVNDGQWHYLAVTRSGSSLSLYIDGNLSASGRADGVADLNSEAVFKIGRSLQYSEYARFAPSASFDDVAIYYTALTASLITAQEAIQGQGYL